MPPKFNAQKTMVMPVDDSSSKSMAKSTIKEPPAPSSALLEPEVNTLSVCLKHAVVKTGQIYAFHADARRLGIHKYASHPPRTLTVSLGRELERYDQLCDTVESQLLRAISVLKRDLAREEHHTREAENATLTRSKSASRSPTSSRVPLPSTDATDVSMPPPPTPGQGSPQGPLSSVPHRRQSAISLSSLHRNPFPLKLDLSSSSMRMTAEEAALFPKGLLPSPVSLAPKSARPSATADVDLIAAFASATAAQASAQRVDIDLTVTDSPPSMMRTIDPALGSSADKPIELDLDNIDMEMSSMTDLFGDAADSASGDGQTAVDSLFSPATTDTGASFPTRDNSAPDKGAQGEGNIDMEILGALSVENDKHNRNLFGNMASMPSGSNGGRHLPSGINAPSSSVSLGSDFQPPRLDSRAEHASTGDTGFDLSGLDLSNLDPSFFDTQGTSMNLTDMEALLNMNQTGSNSEGQKSSS
ncbi:hypothetical protein F5I97DRAFT_1621609 [Phlebopus sp. FC_14]|nr:hypothetical protein F5I97DRAFT_1621609 [Phlebopus sp. FC_14]